MDKVVITLVGMDGVGIIAKMCTYFAENRMNIIDIAQTTVRDVINMIMIIDISPSDKGFDDIEKEMEDVSKDIRCMISVVRHKDLESLAEA